MNSGTPFPSERWFAELGGRMAANESAYRELGPVDCTMVAKVDSPRGCELYEIAFESFGVRSIRRLHSLDDAPPAHFVLEAPVMVWREMIENIRENEGPDLEHTLNYLTFPDDPMVVTGPDQLEVDAFYRYNESLQRFFNGALAVATAYPE